MKNFFRIAFLFQIRNKKNIFNIIFLVISLLLVLYFGSYSLSAKNYVKNDSDNAMIFKQLDVRIGAGVVKGEKIEISAKDYGTDIDFNEILEEYRKNNPQSENSGEDSTEEEKIYTLEELEEIRLELENVDHIVHATNWFSYTTYLSSNEFKTRKLNGIIQIYSANNDSLPEIVLGTDFPDNEGNYMICPENFYPTEVDNYKMISSFSKVNIHDYLNKEVAFNYSSNFQTNDYETTYKIVGFYKNNKSEFDENICYVTHNSFKQIAINMYSDDIDQENGINQIVYQTGFVVQLDSSENIEVVQESLSDLGYSTNLMYISDSSGLDELLSNMMKYSALILFLTFIILILISFKQLEESKNNYQLLSYLGYKKRHILIIHILSNILQIFISIVISIILALILFSLIKTLVYIYPFIFNKWTICTDYSSILLVVIISVVAMIVNTITGIVHFWYRK